MNIVGLSIRRPVGVTVGALLLVMFGLIGLTAIPVQLTPTVDYPIVTVETAWPGRSPEEIVDEITKEQEENLKNISNLKTMRSTSSEGLSTITLEFYLGSDVTRALQEVSDALRQVPDYPDEVTEPTIKDASGAAESAIAWIIVDLDPQYKELHPDFDITTLFDPLDKEFRPMLERIDGVAEANIYGGREREVRVLADNEKLAQRGLNINDLMEALRRENVNTSAGTCNTLPRGDFIYSDATLADTEGGSSGSPVVNSSGQVVGQLFGACGATPSTTCDDDDRTVDGAFAVTYSSVSQWLDPGGGPVCGDPGDSCSANSDCCSNKCRGRRGNKTCR